MAMTAAAGLFRLVAALAPTIEGVLVGPVLPEVELMDMLVGADVVIEIEVEL